ncbi:hypothetical protein HFO24_02745 [Rhizobium laguerreae]|uniref:hypothetical protein n=1 Tax=Rhizobium laguerreae TaxID=1076926 RepID=UPI001C919348|nr:hypothetical protein [Rhizobium laguerreae]MBY3180599.1 hypothetical protein [Rhizobium laguerreae]
MARQRAGESCHVSKPILQISGGDIAILYPQVDRQFDEERLVKGINLMTKRGENEKPTEKKQEIEYYLEFRGGREIKAFIDFCKIMKVAFLTKRLNAKAI